MIIGIGIPSSQRSIPLPILSLLLSSRSALFLVYKFSSGVLDMTDGGPHLAFDLFCFTFGLGLPIASSTADAFFDRALGFLDATGNTFFVHLGFPCYGASQSRKQVRPIFGSAKF